MIAGFISFATGAQPGGSGSVRIWILFFSAYSRSVIGCWRTYLSVRYTPKDMVHMHTIPSESIGHTNESENRQEARSREHVESLKSGRKVESSKALLMKVLLDDLLRSYSGTRKIKYFIIHKFRRLRFSKWMSFENPG